MSEIRDEEQDLFYWTMNNNLHDRSITHLPHQPQLYSVEGIKASMQVILYHQEDTLIKERL